MQFEGPAGSSHTASYDLLVASDGRYSKCRRLYQAHDPSFTSFSKPSPKVYTGFAGLTLPGKPALQSWQSRLPCGCVVASSCCQAAHRQSISMGDLHVPAQVLLLTCLLVAAQACPGCWGDHDAAEPQP